MYRENKHCLHQSCAKQTSVVNTALDGKVLLKRSSQNRVISNKAQACRSDMQLAPSV